MWHKEEHVLWGYQIKYICWCCKCSSSHKRLRHMIPSMPSILSIFTMFVMDSPGNGLVGSPHNSLALFACTYMPLCERRLSKVSAVEWHKLEEPGGNLWGSIQVRGIWMWGRRHWQTPFHQALINALILPWGWRMGHILWDLPALWCTIVHVISTYCHNIGHPVRVTWN